MSKIYKVELYFVDIENEYVDKDNFEYGLENAMSRVWGITHVTGIEESKDFEWDDDLKINNVNATKEDYKEYFK